MMRVMLYLLALWHGTNGLWMLVAPAHWYQTIPGVAETGPANPHFIRDIGLGFLAAGLALGLAARGGARRPLVAVALVFLGGHAALHLIELVDHGGAVVRDLMLIVLPGILPALALRQEAP